MLAGLLVALSAAGAGASSGTVIKEPHDGFSFSIPNNWKQIPLDSGDVIALLKQATHDDPSLANALGNELTSAGAKGIKVFAIGPVKGSSAPTVNVIVSSSAGAPTGKDFAPAAVAQAKIELTQVGASGVKAAIANNHLGRTAEATYVLHLKNQQEYGEQFYALHGAHVDIVTITSGSAAGTKSDARFVANSWHW